MSTVKANTSSNTFLSVQILESLLSLIKLSRYGKYRDISPNWLILTASIICGHIIPNVRCCGNANCTKATPDQDCQAARFDCIAGKLEAVYRAPSVVVVTFFFLVSLASLLVPASHTILNNTVCAVRTDTTFTLLKPG